METMQNENHNQLTECVNRLTRTQRALVDGTKQAAHVTDEYVHQQPWISVGVAVGIGVLLGFLLPRR